MLTALSFMHMYLYKHGLMAQHVTKIQKKSYKILLSGKLYIYGSTWIPAENIRSFPFQLGSMPSYRRMLCSPQDHSWHTDARGQEKLGKPVIGTANQALEKVSQKPEVKRPQPQRRKQDLFSEATYFEGINRKQQMGRPNVEFLPNHNYFNIGLLPSCDLSYVKNDPNTYLFSACWGPVTWSHRSSSLVSGAGQLQGRGRRGRAMGVLEWSHRSWNSLP